MYLILSLDGGGIRSVLTARLLERIQAQRPFLDQVDFFAGTSMGGINALYLAAGHGPTELVNFFKANGSDVFSNRGILDVLSLGLDKVFRSDYSQEPLEEILSGVFGSKRLADLKKRVLITAFDLDNAAEPPQRRWKPKMFHNFPGDTSDGCESVVSVALRSSAAPTYFPSKDGYIDGGIAANNPAMCAVAKAVKSGVLLEDIRLLSIGTGLNQHYVDGDEHDWGLEGWAPKILSIVFDAMVGIPDYQCAQLLSGRYVRINPAITEIDLDDVDKIDELMSVADQTDIGFAIELLSR